jgi:alanine-glyoxylate transaminase/serine-glyoxylate transaminase/serine-pyruvate transaminase
MSLNTPRIPGRRLLHSPGPTPLPDEVLHALMRQPMDMGDPRVDETIAACEAGLKAVLQTEEADVFFYACNGHGAWEAVVENIVPPGGLVLVPGTGHFSESWAVQTEALGRRVQRTAWVEGLPIDPAAVAQALRDDTAHSWRPAPKRPMPRRWLMLMCAFWPPSSSPSSTPTTARARAGTTPLSWARAWAG